MPECNICGKWEESLNKTEIEGGIVDACDDCSKFGKIIERARKPENDNSINFSGSLSDGEILFKEDYGKRVKRARERMGKTRKEFANQINERESIIKRIEQQTMTPDQTLTKKLERSLNISIIENE